MNVRIKQNKMKKACIFLFTLFLLSSSFIFAEDREIGKGFNFGIGAGFYTITIEEDSTSSNPQTGTKTDSNTHMLKAIAPHFLLGIETPLSQTIMIFGEARHVLIKARYERKEHNYSSESDTLFGGISVKIGVRFFL